jgi:hypothetical protein
MLGAPDSCHEHIAHSMNDMKIRKENWGPLCAGGSEALDHDEKHTRVLMHSGMRDVFICLSGTEIEMERSRIPLLKT